MNNRLGCVLLALMCDRRGISPADLVARAEEDGVEIVDETGWVEESQMFYQIFQ